MTLTELEQRTGIKREMLVHIENNEFDQLPNKITAKDLLENMQA